VPGLSRLGACAHSVLQAETAQVEGEIVISWSVEGVFDFVADERNEPSFNERMLPHRLSPLSLSQRQSLSWPSSPYPPRT